MERVKNRESVAFVAIILVLFVFSALPFATASQSDEICVHDNLANGQGDVVRTIPAPEGGETTGLAWDGTYLWCNKRFSAVSCTIYKLNPSDGSVILEFPAQGNRSYDLTWDGTYLWQADLCYHNPRIYKLNPLNGSVISSFPADAPAGLAYDGEYLWYTTCSGISENYETDVIHKVNPSDGTVIRTFDAPKNIVYGLAWDGEYLWCANNYANEIYKLDPSDCSVVSSFEFVTFNKYQGLTWDGTYLWVSHPDKIYQLDVGNSGLPVQNIDTGKSYSTIQAAINDSATEDGHTIRAGAGTYHEDVVVNKSISLIGADRNTTIIEGEGLGGVINVTENDVKISDFSITGTDYENSIGILTGANTTIDNCTITNSRYAIKFGADNCTVKNTLLTDNQYGIYAFEKTNQEIYGNQILNSYQGICLMTGNGTEIHDNVIQNSTAPHGSDIPTGIFLSDTDDRIYNNSFIDNTRQVFVFDNRSNTWNTTAIGNLWSDYNGTGYYVIDENNTDYLPRGFGGASIQELINTASQGDTITISPGTYNENVTVNKTVTLIGTDVEVIGLNPFNVTEDDVKISDFSITGTDYENSIGIFTGANTTIDNCTITNSRYAIKFGADNCTVKNTLLIDNQYGIYAFEKTNQEIYGNHILNSYQGICLMTGNGTEIHDNVIQNSTASHGSDIPTGIFLSDTDDRIYNNSFIDNTRQAFVFDNRSNTWNTSTIGNFWSDYNGTGYYVIDENNTDYLPRGLSVGFDTGEGTYPSISGTHNGTITLTQTIKVNRLYTYPCEGTGGHSEYVAFFNVTTEDEIANGTWNGYDSGNYSYITFDVPFELKGGVTYKYEIRTGSYPQILHQDYLQNSMGNITCSGFTDINGVEYDNWIPAIRLG